MKHEMKLGNANITTFGGLNILENLGRSTYN